MRWSGRDYNMVSRLRGNKHQSQRGLHKPTFEWLCEAFRKSLLIILSKEKPYNLSMA
jgi:hypothetical protein